MPTPSETALQGSAYQPLHTFPGGSSIPGAGGQANRTVADGLGSLCSLEQKTISKCPVLKSSIQPLGGGSHTGWLPSGHLNSRWDSWGSQGRGYQNFSCLCLCGLESEYVMFGMCLPHIVRTQASPALENISHWFVLLLTRCGSISSTPHVARKTNL